MAVVLTRLHAQTAVNLTVASFLLDRPKQVATYVLAMNSDVLYKGADKYPAGHLVMSRAHYETVPDRRRNIGEYHEAQQ
jgi:hypothetical protein